MLNRTIIVQSSDNDYTLSAPPTHAMAPRESNNILLQMFALYEEDGFGASNLMYTLIHAFPGRHCLHSKLRKHHALATPGCPLSYFGSQQARSLL